MTNFIKKPLEAGSVRYVKYTNLKPGETIVIGKYVGTEVVVSKNPKFKDAPQHTFLDLENKTVKLNSAGILNKILEGVDTGSLLEIIYLGKDSYKDKQGIMTPVNTFEVLQLFETPDTKGT